MQLKLTTDYAVRVVLLLSQKHGSTSVTDISRALNISPNYLAKVLGMLKNAGIVASERGSDGGYSLAMRPEKVTFDLVFNAVGDSTNINRCLEKDHYCSRGAESTCPVRKFYDEIQVILDTKFASTAIADLANN